MFLKPGRRVRVRHQKSGASTRASIYKVGEKELLLSMLPGLDLFPGDEIELELRRWGDALCILQASVIEVSDNMVYVLQEQTGLRRPKRRKSERFPANIKTEYLLVPKKDYNSYQEGLIHNISRHGVLLTVREPLDFKSRVFLIFEAPSSAGKSSTTGISGKVVREHLISGKSEYTYGVEFESPLSL